MSTQNKNNTTTTTKSQLNQLRKEYIRLSTELIEKRLAETAALFFAKHPMVKSIEVESSEQYNDNEYYTSFVIDDRDNICINGTTYYNREDESAYDEFPLTEDEHKDASSDAVEMIFAEFDDDDFINVYGDNFSVRLTPTKITINT